MKKLFVMFLAAFMFVAPAAAVEFTLGTPVMLGYKNFSDTKFFKANGDALACFMLYFKYVDNAAGFRYWNGAKNGFLISMPDLYNISGYVFENAADNKIPESLVKLDGANGSCQKLYNALQNYTESIDQLTDDFVWDTFASVANMQKDELFAEMADNQQKLTEYATQSGRMDDNMNGDPDDIYDITASYTDVISMSNASMAMFNSLESYIKHRYCASDVGAVVSCVSNPPQLQCDTLPNITYLERDLNLLCYNSNWEHYIAQDGTYGIRLKRQ